MTDFIVSSLTPLRHNQHKDATSFLTAAISTVAVSTAALLVKSAMIKTAQ